jgi:hypothetical protein
MIETKNFQQLMGGLHVAVLPQNEKDILHNCALSGILRDSIQHEAKIHGATFDAVGFRRAMKAMSAGDVEVLFFAAAWDTCDPKIVGATINFRSLFLQRSGGDIHVHRGIYSEDVCILPSEMKKIILEKPYTKRRPEGGLGHSLIQASIDHYATHGFKDGSIPVGEIFEFAPNNRSIVTIQEKLGAHLGKDEESALFKIESVHGLEDRFKVPVDVQFVRMADGTIDPNNFVVSWESPNAKQKVMASFTKGLSTFKGTPVTQCQFISNGSLPNAGVSECVVSSILKAADQEIGERGWGGLVQSVPSPQIPCDGSVREIFAALFDAQNIILLAPKRREPVKTPPMHIHVLQEPGIAAALKAIGGKQRVLGNRPMQTASLDLRKAAEKHHAPSRPLTLISPDAARHDPIFSLAA